MSEKAYIVKTTKQYQKDVKLAVRRGLDIEKLLKVVRLLCSDEPMPAKFRNHLLVGYYNGYWECHITCVPSVASEQSSSAEIRQNHGQTIIGRARNSGRTVCVMYQQ